MQSCVYKITPSYVDIQITKQGPGEWWPRLLPENFRKPHYLKLDFDRWKTESEDEEVDEVDEKEVQMVSSMNSIIRSFVCFDVQYLLLTLCIKTAIYRNNLKKLFRQIWIDNKI